MKNTASETAGLSHLELREDGVAFLHLGSKEERVITLTPERLRSFEEHLERIRGQKLRALIIMSAAPEMFTAGADISLIRDVTDPSIGENFAREGQRVFSMIEALPFPTIAAISGPCVGGGCELALACTYRVIAEHRSSVIGLPEVKLGILPGFGGTQRLPRLIGLPAALNIILTGKTLRPKQARAVGLVDDIAPSFELLRSRAEAVLKRHGKASRKLSVLNRILTFSGLGRSFVAGKARAQIAKETKGFYPAPPAALEAVLYGLQHGAEKGYVNEARELGRLITSPQSKALVNLFFLTEASKALGKTASQSLNDAEAVVVGAGVMGAGIGAALVKSGMRVLLKDQSDEAAQRGRGLVTQSIEKVRHLSKPDKAFLANRVRASAGANDFGSPAFVIEAVFEDLELKRRIFGHAASHIPANAILATNTSSLAISKIAEGLPSPERVVGLHFFNPVEKMPLIEVIRGAQTSDDVVARTCALAVKLGKYPIVVGECAGFLVNRILTPYLVEAAHLLSEGCSIEQIDRAALHFGMPMGPIRLLDEVGLDVAAHVSAIMSQAFGARMEGPGYAKSLAEAKRLGKKSGAGFYLFSDEKKETVDPECYRILGLNPGTTVVQDSEVQDRLVLALVNEAVRCLDEGIAGVPGREATQQIDLGSVMGFGFPPFHGGLLFYAQRRGIAPIVESLQRLESKHGIRFAPAPGLSARAVSGATLYDAVR